MENTNIFKIYRNSNGIFTSEDIQNIELIKQKIKNLTPTAIREKLIEIGRQVFELFSKNGLCIDDYKNPLLKNPELLNKKFYKQLLRIKYNHAALSSANKQEIKVNPTSYSACLDSFCVDPREIKTSDKIVIHPIETASKILGLQNIHNISNRNFAKNKNILSLIKFKIRLLSKINEYNHKKTFSNSDKNKLKNLVEEYVLIDNYLNKNNISTNNIERYIFNEINFENLEVGKFLSDTEIIVDKGNIYSSKSKENVPTIITFAKERNYFQLKMYNILPSKELDGKNIRRKLNYLLRTENKDGINLLNHMLEVTEKSRQEQIARLNFRIVDKGMLKKAMQPHTLKDIDDIDKAVMIESLENYDSKKYSYSTVKFTNSLKEILLKNNIGRIFLKAQSFNNTNHSPAALYLRLGFTPLFESKESLLEELFSKKRIDERGGIWFEYIKPN